MPFRTDEPVKVPLYKHGEIHSYALVDAECLSLVETWRWHPNPQGYAVRTQWVEGTCRAFLMHRVVMGLTFGDGLICDHINRDKRDNRRANLRLVDHRTNMQNRKAHHHGQSAFRGVHLTPKNNRWRARIRVDNRFVHLGYYATELEAAAAVEAYRAEHQPHIYPDEAWAMRAA